MADPKVYDRRTMVRMRERMRAAQEATTVAIARMDERITALEDELTRLRKLLEEADGGS